MEICPEIPSLYPFLPKNRNAAAICSLIHWRWAYGSVNVGMPWSLRVPLRFPRATAWNCSSWPAVVGFSGVTRRDLVVVVTVEVDIFIRDACCVQVVSGQALIYKHISNPAWSYRGYSI